MPTQQQRVTFVVAPMSDETIEDRFNITLNDTSPPAPPFDPSVQADESGLYEYSCRGTYNGRRRANASHPHHCSTCNYYFGTEAIRLRHRSTMLCHNCYSGTYSYRMCSRGHIYSSRSGNVCEACYPRYWRPGNSVTDMRHNRTGGVSLTYGLEFEVSTRSANYRTLRDITNFGSGSDGSVNGDAAEFVSPILQGNAGMDELQRFCRFARNNNWRADSSCGLHLHIGVNSLTWAQQQAILTMFDLTYDRYWRRWVHSRRDGAGYCRRIDDNWRRYLRDANSIGNFTRRLGTRYYWMNAQAYSEHGTFENRLHQGCVVYTTVRDWVQGNLRFMASAAEQTADEWRTLWEEASGTEERDGIMRGMLGTPLFRRLCQRSARVYRNTLQYAGI